MNICFGIISYLPDDERLRNMRLTSCRSLIENIVTNWNLPVMVIAQNWTIDEARSLSEYKGQKIELQMFTKLGITKAREVLRRKFTESDYDYILCADDDLELSSDAYKINKYLKFVNKNQDKIVEYENYLMNLLGVPKSIFSVEPFDIRISAENSTGYEDWIYVTVLKNKYKERYINTREYKFKVIMKSRHEMCIENNSTWRDSETEDQTDISRKHILTKLIANANMANKAEDEQEG